MSNLSTIYIITNTYIVHMDATHANEVSPDGLYMVRQMEWQKWDIDILPLDRLDQVQ